MAHKVRSDALGANFQLMCSLMLSDITNANLQNLFDKYLISGFTMTLPMIASVVSAGTLSVVLNFVLIICWNIKKPMRR